MIWPRLTTFAVLFSRRLLPFRRYVETFAVNIHGVCCRIKKLRK
ncbi:hypothetical protein GVAMD_1233 [Gardnerella vaginalis AMD]|nr:hypothetical protein GVAMD_1233 [Gardnerella vaginalis AMD]